MYFHINGTVWDFWLSKDKRTMYAVVELSTAKETGKVSNLYLMQADVIW